MGRIKDDFLFSLKNFYSMKRCKITRERKREEKDREGGVERQPVRGRERERWERVRGEEGADKNPRPSPESSVRAGPPPILRSSDPPGSSELPGSSRILRSGGVGDEQRLSRSQSLQRTQKKKRELLRSPPTHRAAPALLLLLLLPPDLLPSPRPPTKQQA